MECGDDILQDPKLPLNENKVLGMEIYKERILQAKNKKIIKKESKKEIFHLNK